MDSICEKQLQKYIEKTKFWLNNYTENNTFRIFFKRDIE